MIGRCGHRRRGGGHKRGRGGHKSRRREGEGGGVIQASGTQKIKHSACTSLAQLSI